MGLDDPVIITCAIHGDDVIISHSTGTVGVPTANDRGFARAAARVAAVNMGRWIARSALGRAGRSSPPHGLRQRLRRDHRTARGDDELGIRSEQWCFDVGDGGSPAPLIDMGADLNLPDGTMAPSNGELVARVARITQGAGRPVTGVTGAREMLGI